jgi:creatinine amidohydrolase
MKWTDIQNYVDKNAIVLLPLGVIEEHGPHLCLGTDIYIAHIQCMYIKEKLKEKGFEAVIAPPFYWGICQATGSFIGSFKARKETVKAVLFDIMASLEEFGFKNVFGINAHGDIDHSVALIEAFKEVNEKLSINARYAFSKDIMHHYGLNGEEPYICPIKSQAIRVSWIHDRQPGLFPGIAHSAYRRPRFPHPGPRQIRRSSHRQSIVRTPLLAG